MKKTLFLLILILVVQVLLRMPFLQEPLERDEGLYGYMGQRILAGEVPYRDVFDHKTPVIYYIYALIIKLFGGSIFSIRIFTLFYSLLTTLSIFFLGRLLWGEGVGVAAALLFAVFSGGPVIQGSNANCEVFMILPLILALYLFILAGREKKAIYYFGAGVLSGLAVMIKQVAAFNLLVLFAFGFSGGLGAVLWLLLGAVLFPLLFTVYFAVQGAFAQFINCLLFANLIYLKNSPAPDWPLYIWQGLDIILHVAFYENSIIWVLSLSAIIYIFVKERKDENRLIAIWAFLSLLAVISSKLFFGHYFIQMLPALVLLSGYAAFKIPQRIRILIVILILLLFIPIARRASPFYFTYSPNQISEKKFGNVFWGRALEVATKLRTTIKSEDDLFVWDSHPEIYFYLGKKSPSYYAYYLNWMGDGPKRIIFREVFEKPPKYIFWATYLNFDRPLMDFIKQKYRLKKKYNIYENITWGLFERKERL
jgi:4-amino-4-deoxy-L-arabinose transferase-like glycosyltransferase